MEPFKRKDRKDFYIKYKDADNIWRIRKGGETLKDAHVTLAKLERQEENIRDGVIKRKDVQTIKAQSVTLEIHLIKYKDI